MIRRVALLIAAACAAARLGAEMFELPPHPPRHLFGNVLISRTTSSGPVKPALFSHWRHRARYTCRVCHLELDFAFKRNATPITEDANRRGAYCGACHDGKIAFGHTDANCDRCHTGDRETGREQFHQLMDLPQSQFGNGVDWSAALAKKAIAPAASLSKDFRPLTLDTTLTLEAQWSFVPPATFPHAEHVQWLDCANCHPDIFNIRRKTTKHFSMEEILKGRFCGACHLHVAFPLDDCKRCHPAMKNPPGK